MADWLLKYNVLSYPRASADVPYQSWPEILFTKDPRFGSFAYLALVAAARRTSGLFAYDTAVSVALAAAIIAIAGMVGARLWSVVLLATGLYTTAWYAYGETGYFGKLIAFPGTVFLSVLMLRYLQADRASRNAPRFALLTAHHGIAQRVLLRCRNRSDAVPELRAEYFPRDPTQVLGRSARGCRCGRFGLPGCGLRERNLARPTAVTYPDWGVGPAYVIFALSIWKIRVRGSRLSRLLPSGGHAGRGHPAVVCVPRNGMAFVPSGTLRSPAERRPALRRPLSRWAMGRCLADHGSAFRAHALWDRSPARGLET